MSFQTPNITAQNIDEEGFHGVFVMEPLERGFGTTLGNSMRRVLLSSLTGYAITSVEIDGVAHEFSTIPGVKEEVTEIILNLKNVILKLPDEGTHTLYVDITDATELKAGDIQCSSDIEIVNPELHIATLDKSAHLVMTLTADKGRGYISCDERKKSLNNASAAKGNGGSSIGSRVIAVDSIYTPVKRVNYTVEGTRHEDSLDYDKLTLDVWTNGTITASEAVSFAAKILTDHLD